MRATLVIPTLERPEILLTVLRSLEGQSVQDFETVVIDQSAVPNDEALCVATASIRPVRYIHEQRRSLPNARNIGAREATTEVLIFIDDDVELSPRFVEEHLRLYSDQSIAAVAGRITGAYDDGPPDATIIGVFNPWLVKVTRNFHLNQPCDSIDQLPGGNFSVRRLVYEQLGGFDPEAFGGPASIGEETDFACRLRKADHRIAFNPDASLIHLHAPRGGCRDDSRTRWTWWHGHNMGVLSRRHCPWYTWPVFIGVQCMRYAGHAVKQMNPLLWPTGCVGMLMGFVGGSASHANPAGETGFPPARE